MILRALVLAALPLAAQAQQEAGAEARAAAQALAEAARQLEEAEGAGDRVRALTGTIRAYERGLGAMRAGLRQAAIRESELSQRLQARDGEVADLLGALLGIGPDAGPRVLLHPEGPMGTARAGMMLAELAPALDARAAALRRDLNEVQTLRRLQQEAADDLAAGLEEVQRARTALNQAMAERRDLPTRFTEDPVRTAILIAGTETLDAFASGLSQTVTDETAPAPVTFKGVIGNLALPVQGLVLRAAQEPDAAGVTRPGILLATRPQAIVTAPTAATIRYVGPLLDLGQVMILEPRADTLFVFAGLGTVYGAAGQVIAEGTPLGLMGAPAGDAMSRSRDGAGTERSETLYIEVRQDNIPQDPATWFRTDKDG